MTTVQHARNVPGLVQRRAAGQRGDAGRPGGLLADVGPLRFVLTRDRWLARFPKRPGNRFQVTQVWVTDHRRWQLAAVQYTSPP
jgi:hypothetical protein